MSKYPSCYLGCVKQSLQSPWSTLALVLNVIQVFFCLACLSVVNQAFLLVWWKLFKVFCPRHLFQGAHPIRTRLRCGVLWKCVNKHLEWAVTSSILLIWIGIYEEENSVVFARFCPNLTHFCQVKGVAELTFQDGWLELITDEQVIKLLPFLSEQLEVLLVRAKWN